MEISAAIRKVDIRTRLISSLLATVMFFAVLAVATISAASSAGAELRPMQAVPSYVNPITNLIEDTGQNMALGQAMSEDLVKKHPAEMLIDLEGTVFFTFRMGLVEETANLAIELLGDDGQAIESLPFSIVEEFPEDNERDIRISTPTEDPILRISLVATPMGREVICFATFAEYGEVVEIPVVDTSETIDDDAAITIVEASPDDEIVGVSDEARDNVLMFLAVAAGILLVLAGIGAYSFLKKKKEAEGVNPRAVDSKADDSTSADK